MAPAGEELDREIRAAVRELRQVGRVPTEVRLTPAVWNALGRRLTYGPFGAGRAVQLDGLPCVLVHGMPPEPGFKVAFLEPRD